MANTPQAKKRIRRNERRAAINGARISRIRTLVKKVESALAAGDKPSARSEGSSGREHAGLRVITLWSAEGDDADVAG